ncbi:hypothetical protein C8J57DRAFT_1507699 [Mycena rebaudengoi]|nr:hypothetical protein C8J57DRAFT_1507699 [Mycena rebaudengoi]
MHNWLEGILEHQLRVLWGIGRHTQQAKALAELDADDEDLWTDDDISEAGAQEDAQDVQDEEQNFDPNEFEKWREQYVRANQSDDDDDEEEEDKEEDDTPKGTSGTQL